MIIGLRRKAVHPQPLFSTRLTFTSSWCSAPHVLLWPPGFCESECDCAFYKITSEWITAWASGFEDDDMFEAESCPPAITYKHMPDPQVTFVSSARMYRFKLFQIRSQFHPRNAVETFDDATPEPGNLYRMRGGANAELAVERFDDRPSQLFDTVRLSVCFSMFVRLFHIPW